MFMILFCVNIAVDALLSKTTYFKLFIHGKAVKLVHCRSYVIMFASVEYK